MRREGRQHGTVRTFSISPGSTPKPGSPPTAGIFTRVTTKPTNHSKFTGKCGRPRCSDCHLLPAWKSKDKIKGVRSKLRSRSGLEVGYGGLLELRVNDESWAYDRWVLESQSASDMLYDLHSYNGFTDPDFQDYPHGYTHGHGKYIFHRYPRRHTVEEVKLNLDSLIEYPFIESAIRPGWNEIEEVQEEEDEVIVEEGDEDEFMIGNLFDEIVIVEDEEMGFYDVGVMWDPIDGDEGWSLIGEI